MALPNASACCNSRTITRTASHNRLLSLGSWIRAAVTVLSTRTMLPLSSLPCRALASSVRLISSQVSARSALIADGHHRYAAYQQLRERHPDQPAWAYGLALLVDSDSFPPRLDAIHRVFDGVPAERLAGAAASWARVDDLTGLPFDASVSRLADAARRGAALLLVDARSRFLVREVDRTAVAAALPDRSARWRSLPTAVLGHLLLPACGLRDEDARLVHDSAAEAVDLACAHQGCAVLLPPPRIDDVYAVVADGERTPRKTTSFGPKPRTGLVLRLLGNDSTDLSDCDGKR